MMQERMWKENCTETAPKEGDGGHEQSIQWDIENWSLPEAWKGGKVITISKPRKDPRNPEWEEDVTLALYAYDNAYFTSAHRAELAAKRIQRVFNLLSEWLDRCRKAVDVSKMASLLIGRQRNMPNQLRLREQDVKWKSCVRYLGTHIDCSLHMIA
ncbi:hypothetical protein EVAR_91696_1 [Eumeta japonica]|uniref:Uncharacterized protein n=1 Tax=Eumeta variegata TaxID=151549 RepID=A0A4C1ZFU9_EUMVA|nr:hypothetical protein EVAR_91696_1 [Eumeta japonica]